MKRTRQIAEPPRTVVLHVAMPIREAVSRPAVMMAVLAAICIACYARTLPYPFVYDDKAVLRDVPAYMSPLQPRTVFTREYFDAFGERTYRPVNSLSFFFDARLWDLSPGGARAANVFLHFLICLLIFGIISALCRNRAAAFFGAAVFAAHPVHSEAVILASNREELLCALFYFAAMYVHLLWLRRRAHTAAFLGFFSAACVLSMFSKEMAAGIPFAVLLSAVCFRDENEGLFASVRRSLPFLLSSGGVVLLFLVLRYTLFRNPTGEVSWPGGSPFATLLTMSQVFFSYAGLILYPVRMCAQHVVQATASFAGAAAVCVVLLALLLVLSIAFAGKRRFPPYVFLFFLLSWLPVSNIIPFGELMAERYIYIPSFAFSAAAAWLFMRMRGGVFVSALLFAAILALTASTVVRAPAWDGDLAIWSDTVSCAPHGSTGHLNLGNAYAARGDYKKALEEYLAASGCPDLKEPQKVEYNSGLALLATGKIHAAEQMFNAAILTDPSFALPHLNLGSLAEKRGDLAAAEKHFLRAAKLAPNNAAVLYAAGRFFLIHHTDPDGQMRAYHYLSKSSLFNPDAADTHAALAAAVASTGVGDIENVIEEINWALHIDPDNMAARMMAKKHGITYSKEGFEQYSASGISKMPAAFALCLIIAGAAYSSLRIRKLSLEGGA